MTGKVEMNLITLPIDPKSIPGVASVTTKDGRMIVQFSDGKTATVERSPLARFSHRDSFDVWLPPTRTDAAAEVALSKSPAEVVSLLNKMAALAG